MAQWVILWIKNRSKDALYVIKTTVCPLFYMSSDVSYRWSHVSLVVCDSHTWFVIEHLFWPRANLCEVTFDYVSTIMKNILKNNEFLLCIRWFLKEKPIFFRYNLSISSCIVVVICYCSYIVMEAQKRTSFRPLPYNKILPLRLTLSNKSRLRLVSWYWPSRCWNAKEQYPFLSFTISVQRTPLNILRRLLHLSPITKPSYPPTMSPMLLPGIITS